MASSSARECNLNRGDVRPKPSLALVLPPPLPWPFNNALFVNQKKKKEKKLKKSTSN